MSLKSQSTSSPLKFVIPTKFEDSAITLASTEDAVLPKRSFKSV